ncbi:hypothetical protein [Sporomusa sp.]|uniref:hypothetical protein n=1 Tax=Sporomusa sp. TaxID=2078658 RepID=UPI002CFADCCA|nr:hypothetical protein [Sporomusa sp.]HWR09341.1 hypothetical protein [Sporomusa sp.]
METINVVEWLGYLASGMVAVSFVMKSINKLRFINLVGAILFVIYGIAIQAVPVVLANLFVVGVNIYYLVWKNA